MNDDDKKPEEGKKAATPENDESLKKLEGMAGEWQPGPNADGGKSQQESTDKARANLAAQIEGLNLMIFEGVAAMRGDHWRLQQTEAKLLAEAEVACLPDDLDDLPPWVGLCMVAGMVVLPRLAQDRAVAAANDDKKEGAKDAA